MSTPKQQQLKNWMESTGAMKSARDFPDLMSEYNFLDIKEAFDNIEDISNDDEVDQAIADYCPTVSRDEFRYVYDIYKTGIGEGGGAAATATIAPGHTTEPGRASHTIVEVAQGEPTQVADAGDAVGGRRRRRTKRKRKRKSRKTRGKKGKSKKVKSKRAKRRR